jgi:tetratricopeptide (TPR) repeat protein/DNA-binding winged helix-turn-helix (wHTH) protein
MPQVRNGVLTAKSNLPVAENGRGNGVHPETQVSPASRPTYRCEDVEIDTAQGCVKRAGREGYLRQQSFHVLVYLLERRQRLISKEELIENFWHDTAVTDNALVQCIAEIRRALGDEPRQPRFIKTIPKVGYRFVGAVEVEEKYPAAVKGTVPSGLPEASSRVRAGWIANLVKSRLLATILGLIAVAILSWMALRHSSAARVDVTIPPAPGKKSLAVMYFENQSARPDLDWLREGLADMFITDLARSDKLMVLSRQQLHLLLNRIGRKSTDIRLDDALDVGRRSHADSVLLGSFASLGEQILINVQLFNTTTGQLAATDRLVVNRTADLLTQVDLLSLKLSAQLGVAARGAAQKAGLGDVMTGSVEAYRYYSLGVSKAHAFENVEAIALLRKAVQLDPKFAMAYARIGYAYSVTDFLPEQGRPFLEKAFQMSDRLTKKDQLYVKAWYGIARQDYPTAIETFRQIVRDYPLETEACARLSRLLYREERPEEAIAVARRGLAADPEAKDLFNVLGIYFLGLGRYDEAIASHQRYVELAPDEANAHDSLGMSYQQSGRYDKAAAEYNAALSLDPEFEPAIIHMGDLSAQQGRYQDAIEQYRRYIQVTRSDAARAVGYGDIAQVYWRKHDLRRGEQAAESELKYEKSAVWNSLLFAQARGDRAAANRLKEMLVRNVPYPERGGRHEGRSHLYYLGMLALQSGHFDEAISDFKEALRHLPPSSGLDLYEDCLANAYLQSGNTDEAIREYQRVLHLNPNYPLAEYHLAQAYDRKGDIVAARASYQHFLESWGRADSDTPEVLAAKKSTLSHAASGASQLKPQG